MVMSTPAADFVRNRTLPAARPRRFRNQSAPRRSKEPAVPASPKLSGPELRRFARALGVVRAGTQEGAKSRQVRTALVPDHRDQDPLASPAGLPDASLRRAHPVYMSMKPDTAATKPTL